MSQWDLSIELQVKNLEKLLKEVKDKFEKTWDEAGKKTWDAFTEGFGKQFTKIKNLIAGAFVGNEIFKYIKWVVTLWSNLEKTTVAFETMLGSSELAKSTLEDLSDFASKTPFDIVGIRDNAKQLLAMGVNIDNLLPTMKMLGDLSAGLSVDMGRLTLAYGQTLAKWVLQGGELKQFMEAGVPLISELAKQFWVAEGAIYDMTSAGEISARDVSQALESMTSDGGRFANLMEKQSATFWGTISNIEDDIIRMWEKIGTAMLPQLTEVADGIKTTVSEYGEGIGDILAWTMQVVLDIITGVVTWATELFNVLIGNTARTEESQINFLQVVGAVFKAFLIWLQTIVKGISSVGKVWGTTLGSLAINVANFFEGTINKAIDGINFLITNANKLAGTSFSTIKPFKVDPVSWSDFTTMIKDDTSQIIDDFSKIDFSLNIKKGTKEINQEVNKLDLSKIIGGQKEIASGTGKSTDATKKLKEETKKLEDWYKDYEDKVKAVEKATDSLKKATEKMNKTISEGLRDVLSDISKLGDEYAKTIDKIDTERLSDSLTERANFIRSQAEAEAELEKSRIWEKDYEKRLEIERELATVRETLVKLTNSETEELIKQERYRASLWDNAREVYDYEESQKKIQSESDLKKKVAEEEYQNELSILQRRQAIYEYFQNMENVNSIKLKKLTEDEYYKSMDTEEQKIFDKLLGERLEYQQSVEMKKRLEREVTDTIISLSNEANAVMKANVNNLTLDYQNLINRINQAIQAQRQLNAMKVSQRYNWWPVEAGRPYLVGENPDGSINRTTELFIPKQHGQIITASKLKQALSEVSRGSSVDRSKSVTIDKLITNRGERPSDIIARLSHQL